MTKTIKMLIADDQMCRAIYVILGDTLWSPSTCTSLAAHDDTVWTHHDGVDPWSDRHSASEQAKDSL